jgi:phage shock protein PspC (stress-responsive transcriptional regulator)
MQKVISINLNGNAYQLDENGYATLREYLARAEQALSDNPDRAEILRDLEQAIAEKCQRYLGPHKTVVTASEVDQIVAEMGPVDAAAGASAGRGESDEKSGARGDRQESTAKRLYRIADRAMIAGVCNGIAAYFQVDVTVVRIGFVAAALITKGFAIIAYVVMMAVVPEAKTPEARAAAAGAPFNAKEIIDRAKKQYAEGQKQWRRQWRQQRRHWQRYGWSPPGAAVAYGPPPWAAILLPVFGMAQVALFLLMAAMVVSLVNTGAVLNWHLPPDVPVWAGVLILLVAYQIAVAPLRAVNQWASFPRPGADPAWFAFWNALTWLVGLAFMLWFASNHVPEIREFLTRMPDLIRDFVQAMRDLVAQYRAEDTPR